jgi:chromosome segregation ATPase
LKQKYDEIVRQQQENKLALEQKQREIQNLQQAILDLQTQISQLNQERSDLKSTIVLTEQRVQEITAERDQIKLESDTSKRRTEEVETEFKALERRHALMMKDYQKQMQKQQQQQQQQQQQTVIQPVSVKQDEPKQQIPSVRSSTETTESKRLAEEVSCERWYVQT